MQDDDTRITPHILLQAYSCGMFPMAESAEADNLFWLEPEKRGIIPLNGFKLSSSLRKTIRQNRYHVSFDQDFNGVVDLCATETDERPTTWINSKIKDLYSQLHQMGHAHSLECWQDNQLVGGLYGVSLKGAFFGESMFYRKRDASKVALAYLVARLKAGGYILLDTQFITPHLASLGAIEIKSSQYQQLLQKAMQVDGNFYSLDGGATSDLVLQLVIQTS